MRIVAGGAADALVISQKALTIGQTIGLKADILLAKQAQADHGFPRAMTLAAEIRHLFGGHLAQLPGMGAGRPPAMACMCAWAPVWQCSHLTPGCKDARVNLF